MFYSSRKAGSLLVGLTAMSYLATLSATASAQQLALLSKPLPKILSSSIAVGTADPSQVVHLCVSLNPPSSEALEEYAKSVSDPTSPNYGKFLTPAEFGARFGQSEETFQKVRTYLESKGFKVKLAADNHLNLVVEGTVAQAEDAFNTTFNKYLSLLPNDPGRKEFFSYSTPLSMPKEIAPVVGSISGLENHVRAIPKMRKLARKGRQSSVTQPLTPGQASTLYKVAPLHAANLYGQSRTVGISNFDGYELSNISMFYKQFSLPTPPGGVLSNVKIETIDGGNANTEPGGEGDLDQQMVLGQAPLSNLIIYDGGGDLLPVLSQEAQDNKADVITESYGWQYDASEAEAAHNLHLQLTAEGITYFLASGDYGTEIDGSTPPATYGDYDTEVTNVGGTVASINSAGVRTAEVGWYGSAGGWVTTPNVPFNTLPSWMHGTGVPTNIHYRLLPDVALHAAGSNDPDSDHGAFIFFYDGENIVVLDGGQGGVSGTSFASPVFAGAYAVTEQNMIAQSILKTNAAGIARMGRINDLIYAQNGRSDVWFDVTQGNNGVLPNGAQSYCTKGWDSVTGWGAANFQAFSLSLKASNQIIVQPTAVSVSLNEGTAPTGTVANLDATDSKYYTVNSVKSSTGAIASAQIKYKETTAPATLHALTLTLVAKAPVGVNATVNAYNYHTKTWNTLNTTAMTGANKAISVNLPNYTQLVNTDGSLTLTVAGTSSKPFTLSVDEALVFAVPSAPAFP